MRSEIFSSIDDISINITNLNGKVIDISRLLLTLEFYENIFEFFMTGKLIIADTLDLPQHFPIIGGENVEISLTTTDISTAINVYMKVYKLERDVTNIRGDIKKRVLILYLCSEEYLKNNIISISKKFSGKPETIINNVLTELESTKTCDSESGLNDIVVYSNFWHPQKIIDFVCKISETTDYKDYIFYEHLNGFSFKPLSYILNQDPLFDFVYDTSTESIINSNNIKMFRFNSRFDLNVNSKTGLFGTTFYTPHDTEYSYQKIAYDLKENVEKIVTHGLSLPYNDDIISDNNQVNVNWYDPEISSIRLASVKLFQNYNLAVKLNGDFNRKSGDVVNLDYPNYDNENNLHISFDGKWLITAIKHTISQTTEYQQNMLLVKNAFFNNSDLTSINSLNNI